MRFIVREGKLNLTVETNADRWFVAKLFWDKDAKILRRMRKNGGDGPTIGIMVDDLPAKED